MRTKSKFIATCIFLFFFSISMMAQVRDPGDDPDAPATPIDAGISLIIVGGAAYGLYELRRKK